MLELPAPPLPFIPRLGQLPAGLQFSADPCQSPVSVHVAAVAWEPTLAPQHYLYLFIHSCNAYLVTPCCVQVSVLGTVMNRQTRKSLPSWSLGPKRRYKITKWEEK